MSKISKRVCMTEYLAIDLDTERWTCRRCEHDIGDANDDYKKGLLLNPRDPGEVHKPLIDPEKYEFTFQPDKRWCQIVEFYCPGCGTMVEVEYLIPGHPPLYQHEVDIKALKKQVKEYPQMLEEPSVGPDVPARHDHSRHDHMRRDQ